MEVCLHIMLCSQTCYAHCCVCSATVQLPHCVDIAVLMKLLLRHWGEVVPRLLRRLDSILAEVPAPQDKPLDWLPELGAKLVRVIKDKEAPLVSTCFNREK